MARRSPPADTGEWLAQCEDWRKKYPLKYAKQGGLRAQHVLDRLHHVTGGNAIITTDVGQHQMWAAQFCLSTTNRHWISSGGAGTMGFGFPVGDRRAARLPGQEGLGRGRRRRLPDDPDGARDRPDPFAARAKCLIINNNFLGMVRQWQELFFENRLSGVDLVGNPDFVKLAEAYGVKAFRIRRPADVDRVLTEAHAYDEGPCVVVAEVVKEDNVFPMIPAGAPLSG